MIYSKIHFIIFFVFLGFPVRITIENFLSRFSIMMGRKSILIKQTLDKYAAIQLLVISLYCVDSH